MWGRKWKAAKVGHAASIAAAQKGLTEANRIIALVDSRVDEVEARVANLERRAERNNFGEALKIAMKARAEGEQTA